MGENKRPRVFLDIDINGTRAAYQRAKEFVAARNLAYNLTSNDLEELGGSEKKRVKESLYPNDFEWGSKVRVSMSIFFYQCRMFRFGLSELISWAFQWPRCQREWYVHPCMSSFSWLSARNMHIEISNMCNQRHHHYQNSKLFGQPGSLRQGLFQTYEQQHINNSTISFMIVILEIWSLKFQYISRINAKCSGIQLPRNDMRHASVHV